MTIATNPWVLWLLLTILLFTALFILVPRRIIRQYLLFGLVLGFIQAIVIVWLFQFVLQCWELVGDPAILGIATLFTPIAWIAPTIIYAAYFPQDRRWYYIAGYVLLFALGAVVVQLILEALGMWRDIRWNPVLTGLLATASHVIITIVMLKTRARVRV